MRRLRRLVGSLSFRLALIYTLIFAVSVSGLFYFVYWATSGFAFRQIEAAIQAEVAGFQDSYQRAGMSGLVMAINRRSDPNLAEHGVYALVDGAGQVVAGNLSYWPQFSPEQDSDIWVNFKILERTEATEETADVRAVRFFVPDGYGLLVGRDIRDAQQFRRQLLDSFGTGIALTVIVGLLGGLLFGTAAMRRIETIARTCRTIMRGDLSKRVPVKSANDEIGELSTAVNAMLDQIERLMVGMQQVSDNVAHDLRTPLNRLRSRLEAAQRHVRDPDAKAAIESALDDADGLLATFAALLRIARAEAGLQRNFVNLDLAAIGHDVAEMYQPLAEEKNVAFEVQLEAGVGGRGDRNLIAQALANLVDNAIKYTPENGKVTLSLSKRDGRPTFAVADSGPGVPDAYKDKVLQRLFRLEQSRTSPGSGLGLSLVNAVARSHGLQLKLEDNHPGLRVSLSFDQAVPVPVSEPRYTMDPEPDAQPVPAE